MTFEELVKANEGIKTMDFRGKAYAEVNQRVKAFRMLFPEGSITTEIVSLEGNMCVMRATICNEDGKVLATGTAYEREGSTNINKTSYIENCETSAIGRALGIMGLGIDTSIASAEEVANAVEQQEGNKKIDDAKIAAILAKAKESDIPVEHILESCKIDSISDMTVTQFTKTVTNWEKFKEWSDKKKHADEGNN